MPRSFSLMASSIGARLTIGFGFLVGLMLLVVTLTLIASRAATRSIESTEAVSAPATLASAGAHEALLRMQLHLRGYLVLSDAQDIAQYYLARDVFESRLAALQGLISDRDQPEQERLHALMQGYEQWKLLPPKLFELHENALLNRPALRLARIDVQALRVGVLSVTEQMIAQQQDRLDSAASRDMLTAMLTFQNSFDTLATNVMAFGASGENSFKLTYSSQLIANAALWHRLVIGRNSLGNRQRQELDRIADARATLIDLALQVRSLQDGEHAYEDLFLLRTEVVPQANELLNLLQQVMERQQSQLESNLSLAREKLARSQDNTITGGILALVLGTMLAGRLRRSIVVPVRRLTHVAGLVTRGNLAARAHTGAPDEIGMLAASFNTMTERLAETISNLESACRDAQQARHSAEGANRAKSSFLANMSHELRTPLNAILGYAQILRKADSGARASHTAGLNTIQQSGEHLLLLINDLLDLARIEAGRVELQVDDVDLGRLLRTVADIVGLEARNKNLKFQYEISGDVPSVLVTDERRLRQVLLNVLNNAVKFTDCGEVTLRVTLIDIDIEFALVRFEIQDTGCGIDEKNLERIFEPFEQTEKVQRRFGGTGLGLAISRQLVALADSEIKVHSIPGVGSRFWFELKLPRTTRCTLSPTIFLVAKGEQEDGFWSGVKKVGAVAFVKPPPEECDELLRLARIGNMRGLRHHAERLGASDARHRPLADRLCVLADEFDPSTAIELLVSLNEQADAKTVL